MREHRSNTTTLLRSLLFGVMLFVPMLFLDMIYNSSYLEWEHLLRAFITALAGAALFFLLTRKRKRKD